MENVFNSIIVDCPNCGENLRFKTESGRCNNQTYHIESVPKEEFIGIEGKFKECYNCHRTVTITPRSRDKNDYSNLVYTAD